MVDGFVRVLGALGPPRLYDESATGAAVTTAWALPVVLLVAAVLLWIGFGVVRRRMLGDERMAFVMLSRRMKLGRQQKRAVERLAARAGAPPVGLLVCESAFVRAVHGQRLDQHRSVESKAVLLTAPELLELGRVAERLFGPGCLEQARPIEPEDRKEEVADEAFGWVA
ncbi:MAG: hypothetical protein ACNA8P_11510 [Phycisphaerales bacterium]